MINPPRRHTGEAAQLPSLTSVTGVMIESHQCGIDQGLRSSGHHGSAGRIGSTSNCVSLKVYTCLGVSSGFVNVT